MFKPVQAAASVLCATLLLAACSTNDKNYAHEVAHHPTAAEQLFGTTGGPYTPAPVTVVAAEPVTVVEPVVVAPATPAQPITVPQTVSRMVPSDAAFTQRVLSSSAAEIEMARIAFVRAQSNDVRAFARQMLMDHRQMAINTDNFGLVRGYLVDWRIEPEAASAIDRLRTVDQASFDRAYMDTMVSAHEQAVATLETQVGSGRETAALASDALPTVRHHLARALQVRL